MEETQEEHPHAEDHPLLADSEQKSPPRNVPRRESSRVPRNRNGQIYLRINVINSLNEHYWKRLMGCFGVCWNGPKLLAIAIILALHPNERCDVRLPLWLTVELGRLCVAVVISVWFLTYPVNSKLLWFYESSRLVHFVWFILGFYWLLSAHSCSHTAPLIYRLTLALLITDFVDFFKSCLILMCVAPLVLCCLPRLLRYLPEDERGASAHVIQSLPSEKYREGLVAADDNICPICQQEYVVGEELRMLRCHPPVVHHFHVACIDRWLTHNASCPTCRKPVFEPDMEADVGGIIADGSSG